MAAGPAPELHLKAFLAPLSAHWLPLAPGPALQVRQLLAATTSGLDKKLGQVGGKLALTVDHAASHPYASNRCASPWPA